MTHRVPSGALPPAGQRGRTTDELLALRIGDIDGTAVLGGGRGIRTHDGCDPIAVFKTAAIGR